MGLHASSCTNKIIIIITIINILSCEITFQGCIEFKGKQIGCRIEKQRGCMVPERNEKTGYYIVPYSTSSTRVTSYPKKGAMIARLHSTQ